MINHPSFNGVNHIYLIKGKKINLVIVIDKLEKKYLGKKS